MRLQKTHKMILAGLLAVALTIPAATVVKTVHASETQIPFAQSEDGTVHETSFDLARVSDSYAWYANDGTVIDYVLYCFSIF